MIFAVLFPCFHICDQNTKLDVAKMCNCEPVGVDETRDIQGFESILTLLHTLSWCVKRLSEELGF